MTSSIIYIVQIHVPFLTRADEASGTSEVWLLSKSNGHLLVGLDSLDSGVFTIDATLSLGDEFSSGQGGLQVS